MALSYHKINFLYVLCSTILNIRLLTYPAPDVRGYFTLISPFIFHLLLEGKKAIICEVHYVKYCPSLLSAADPIIHTEVCPCALQVTKILFPLLN